MVFSKGISLTPWGKNLNFIFLLALNQVAFVWFLSAVYVQMYLQRTWVRASKVTLVTFARLSPRCIFKRFLKLPAWKQVISHWLHLFGCLHCVFSNVPSKHLDQRKQSRIDSMCFIFPQCAFSNDSSNWMPEKRQSHIGYICLTFFHCVFSNASSNGLPEKRQSHIGCICLTFLHCVFSNVSSNSLPEKRHSHIGCIY